MSSRESLADESISKRRKYDRDSMADSINQELSSMYDPSVQSRRISFANFRRDSILDLPFDFNKRNSIVDRAEMRKSLASKKMSRRDKVKEDSIGSVKPLGDAPLKSILQQPTVDDDMDISMDYTFVGKENIELRNNNILPNQSSNQKKSQYEGNLKLMSMPPDLQAPTHNMKPYISTTSTRPYSSLNNKLKDEDTTMEHTFVGEEHIQTRSQVEPKLQFIAPQKRSQKAHTNDPVKEFLTFKPSSNLKSNNLSQNDDDISMEFTLVGQENIEMRNNTTPVLHAPERKLQLQDNLKSKTILSERTPSNQTKLIPPSSHIQDDNSDMDLSMDYTLVGRENIFVRQPFNSTVDHSQKQGYQPLESINTNSGFKLFADDQLSSKVLPSVGDRSLDSSMDYTIFGKENIELRQNGNHKVPNITNSEYGTRHLLSQSAHDNSSQGFDKYRGIEDNETMEHTFVGEEHIQTRSQVKPKLQFIAPQKRSQKAHISDPVKEFLTFKPSSNLKSNNLSQNDDDISMEFTLVGQENIEMRNNTTPVLHAPERKLQLQDNLKSKTILSERTPSNQTKLIPPSSHIQDDNSDMDLSMDYTLVGGENIFTRKKSDAQLDIYKGTPQSQISIDRLLSKESTTNTIPVKSIQSLSLDKAEEENPDEDITSTTVELTDSGIDLNTVTSISTDIDSSNITTDSKDFTYPHPFSTSKVNILVRDILDVGKDYSFNTMNLESENSNEFTGHSTIHDTFKSLSDFPLTKDLINIQNRKNSIMDFSQPETKICSETMEFLASCNGWKLLSVTDDLIRVDIRNAIDFELGVDNSNTDEFKFTNVTYICKLEDEYENNFLKHHIDDLKIETILSAEEPFSIRFHNLIILISRILDMIQEIRYIGDWVLIDQEDISTINLRFSSFKTKSKFNVTIELGIGYPFVDELPFKFENIFGSISNVDVCNVFQEEIAKSNFKLLTRICRRLNSLCISQ